MSERALMPDNAQENILITPNGQACLGEFGITGTFLHFDSRDHQLGIIRYIAPECDPLGFQAPKRSDPSEESDVYSLALTSFSVRSSITDYHTVPPETIHPLRSGPRWAIAKGRKYPRGDARGRR